MVHPERDSPCGAEDTQMLRAILRFAQLRAFRDVVAVLVLLLAVVL